MQADIGRFSALISALGEYHGKTLSAGVIGLYAQGLLHRYSIETLERAVMTHIDNPDTGQFMPKVADIVRMIDGDTKDAASLAWAKAIGAASSVGAYRSVVFDDPIIHAIVRDIGGWTRLCHTSEDEAPFLERRFRDAYRAYANRGGSAPDYPLVLGGISDTHNGSRGFSSDPPVLIGDKTKAQAVMSGSAGLQRRIAPSGVRRLSNG